MRLWLDDERDPKNPKIQKLFNSKGDEIWVKTAWEAIEYLKTNKVKFISLDHDLGPEEAGTGMDVAKWIEENAYLNKLSRLVCKVHSQNVIGSKNIKKALYNAERFWKENESNISKND